MIQRSAVILVGAVGLVVPSHAAAGAPPGCNYDELPNHVLEVGGDAEVGLQLNVVGGEIVVTHLLSAGGGQTITCNGPTPTTSNVDTINVGLLEPGDGDELRISNPPAFTPGFTGEPSANEIEIHIDFFDGHTDGLHLIVGESNLKLGSLDPNAAAVDWNPSSPFPDADITFTQAERVEVVAGAQNSTLSATGSSATGDPLALPLYYKGGSARDIVFSGEGADDLDGRSGRDVLRGAEGDDDVTGGAGGRDRLFGQEGLDHLFAKDGKRDKTLDCGPGANGDESAKRDKNKDPQPKSC